MKQLLIIKEKIKKFVGKNEVFILPVLKFLLTFLALSQINSKLGFMTRLSNGAITLIVALAGSFLPMNLTLVILAVITVAHCYALSFEVALVVLAMFLILFLLYFRFASKDSVAALLVPLGFVFKMPYVMPVSMGLVGTPSSIVSTVCGVIVYEVLHFISGNADSLASDGGISISELGNIKTVVDGVVNNKAMIVLAVSFAITVLVVYIIRRLSVPYSWQIAIATGTIVDFIVILIGNAATDAGISIGGAFVGMIVSIIINFILQYFAFDLDYNRVEKVQFEDDEYYYYVKAVPKNTIKLSDNGKKKKAPARKPAADKAEAPVRERVSRPVERPVEEETETPPVSSARQAVRANAAKAAQSRSTNKGPLGLSGGRPAREGRRKEIDG